MVARTNVRNIAVISRSISQSSTFPNAPGPSIRLSPEHHVWLGVGRQNVPLPHFPANATRTSQAEVSRSP
eukprot:scaffold305_cov247-Pinguiococcus_pyrenoidosus.AAC.10